MKIAFPGIMVALACLVFIGRMEAAKSPSPSATPTPIAPPIPAPQLALHDQLLPALSAVARAWVTDEAEKARKKTTVTEAIIRADIQTRFTGQSLTDADKNIMLYIVLTEAARDMGDDLSNLFNELLKKHTAGQTPDPSGHTSISLTPDETTQLQAAMQRRTEFMTAMSNVMKKINGAQGVVVGNLK